MSTKTWSHVSPTVGLDSCGAQSPESCKFKDSKHFSAKAVERINAGRPANFDEHEAMVKHREITAQHNMEGGSNSSVPKPGPAKVPAVPTAPKPGPVAPPRPTPSPARPVAPFPGRSQQGRPVAPFPTQHRQGGSYGRPQRTPETLYHMELGFPSTFVKPSGRKELDYGSHAMSATLDDRYGRIPVLNSINVDKLQMVELGVDSGSGRVSKIVYRGHLDEERDMCIVVIPKPPGQKWFVKTVWINLRSDQHRTLDESKYARPAA